MEYIVCIDGGGTKTEAIAYNYQGEELCKIYTGYGNPTLNREVAVSNVIEAIEKCTSTLKEHKLIEIFLGIAGIEAGDNRKIFKEAVEEKFGVNVEVYNDAEMALFALLKGEDGILTISGTGSISFGIINGVKVRSGGWGHILGDEGSGYYIAIQAFRRMIFEDEEGLERSRMSSCILKKLELENVDGIKGFIYSSTKDQIASITPLIAKLADEGECIAIEMLHNAGMEIAKTTERVWKRMGRPDDIKIALKGSVITKIKYIRETFDSYIVSRIKNALIIDDDISSTKGGYYLALKDWKKGVNRI